MSPVRRRSWLLAALTLAAAPGFAADPSEPSDGLVESTSILPPHRPFYYAGEPAAAPLSQPADWSRTTFETIHLDLSVRSPLPDDIREWVRTERWPVVAMTLVAYTPEDPVSNELEAILRAAGPEEPGLYSRALRALWQVDPTRAAAVAGEVPPEPHYLVNDSVARLRVWPSADAAYTAMVSMGFEGERRTAEYGDFGGAWNNGGVQWPLRPLTVVDELQAMGTAICFDMEIAELPIAYHELAYTLAALHTGFPDASFGSSRTEHGAYELAAWYGDSSWSVELEDNGDWIEVPGVLGLLNTVALHGQSTIRFAMLPADGQSLCVVGAASTAIEALDSLDIVRIDYRY